VQYDFSNQEKSIVDRRASGTSLSFAPDTRRPYILSQRITTLGSTTSTSVDVAPPTSIMPAAAEPDPQTASHVHQLSLPLNAAVYGTHSTRADFN